MIFINLSNLLSFYYTIQSNLLTLQFIQLVMLKLGYIGAESHVSLGLHYIGRDEYVPRQNDEKVVGEAIKD